MEILFTVIEISEKQCIVITNLNSYTSVMFNIYTNENMPYSVNNGKNIV